jgi:hypothetical protein
MNIMKKIHVKILFILAIIILSYSLIGGDEKNKVSNSSASKITLSEQITFPHEKHFDIMGNCKSCHNISSKSETPSCKTCHGPNFSFKDLKGSGLKTKTGKKVIPEYFTFNEDSKIFEPVTFTHLAHYDIIGNCKECHHYSSSESETPRCSSCHGAPFGSENISLGKPGLKGALHQKCMGCHKEYNVGPVICVDCHKKYESKK